MKQGKFEVLNNNGEILLKTGFVNNRFGVYKNENKRWDLSDLTSRLLILTNVSLREVRDTIQVFKNLYAK